MQFLDDSGSPFHLLSPNPSSLLGPNLTLSFSIPTFPSPPPLNSPYSCLSGMTHLGPGLDVVVGMTLVQEEELELNIHMSRNKPSSKE